MDAGPASDSTRELACADRSDVAVVEAVVSLAHGLGMTVTAEGAGEVAQQAALRALRCDHLQGFGSRAAMSTGALLGFVDAGGGIRAA